MREKYFTLKNTKEINDIGKLGSVQCCKTLTNLIKPRQSLTTIENSGKRLCQVKFLDIGE